eukprot:TRINITY_DN6138_c0_g1_i1.p1 TRINITY_DN6138_c0_g1~~TRINITY_DN6138_c0_g1_i1.p1  ORF type:complete len:553 (+),score=97.35 TRINITY_DN6138_c0_g1_i1:155-1813(+)
MFDDENDESPGDTDICLPPVNGWEFPLTRAEKMQRLLRLFEAEMESRELELDSLRSENSVLSSALAAAQASAQNIAQRAQQSIEEPPVEVELCLAACGGTCVVRGSPEQVNVVLKSLGATSKAKEREVDIDNDRTGADTPSSASSCSSPACTPPASPCRTTGRSGQKPLLPGLRLGQLAGGSLAAPPLNLSRRSFGSRHSLGSCVGATPRCANTPRIFTIRTPPTRTPRLPAPVCGMSPSAQQLGAVITPRGMSRVWSLVTPRASTASKAPGGLDLATLASTPRPLAASPFGKESATAVHGLTEPPLRRRSRQGLLMSLAEDEPRRGSVSSGSDDQSETTSTNDVAKQATEASTTDTEADEEPSALNLKFALALDEEGQHIDDKLENETGEDELHQDQQSHLPEEKIDMERPCWPPSPATRAQMVKDICEELRAMGHLPVDADEERTGPHDGKKGCSGPVCQGSRAAASAAEHFRSGLAQAAEAGTPSKVGSKVVEISSLALDIAGAAAEKARLGFSAVLGRAQAGVARSTAASESLAQKRRHRLRLVHDDW